MLCLHNMYVFMYLCEFVCVNQYNMVDAQQYTIYKIFYIINTCTRIQNIFVHKTYKILFGIKFYVQCGVTFTIAYRDGERMDMW